MLNLGNLPSGWLLNLSVAGDMKRGTAGLCDESRVASSLHYAYQYLWLVAYDHGNSKVNCLMATALPDSIYGSAGPTDAQSDLVLGNFVVRSTL